MGKVKEMGEQRRTGGGERDEGRRGSEVEKEGGRMGELLPLGGCGSRPGQRRLILVNV